MSDAFFQDLGLPAPDENLGVGSGPTRSRPRGSCWRSSRCSTGTAPDWVVVYGDVNSTVACALVAVKKGIRIAHVEAGLGAGTAPCPRRSTGS